MWLLVISEGEDSFTPEHHLRSSGQACICSRENPTSGGGGGSSGGAFWQQTLHQRQRKHVGSHDVSSRGRCALLCWRRSVSWVTNKRPQPPPQPTHHHQRSFLPPPGLLWVDTECIFGAGRPAPLFSWQVGGTPQEAPSMDQAD